MSKSTSFYIPDNVLIIENTSDLEMELSRQTKVNATISEQPSLNFSTIWGDTARWFVRPSEEFMEQTGRLFRTKNEKYFPDNSDGDTRDSNCRSAKVGTYTNLPGQYYVNAKVGVAALGICTQINGLVGFPGYIHSVSGDVNIVIPRNSGLAVFAQAENGVKKNGQHVKNVPIPEFEKYFNPKQTKEMREFMREHFDLNYTWLNFLDGIRTRSKLYLRADGGSINITYLKTPKETTVNGSSGN